jgi:hypothetical protein
MLCTNLVHILCIIYRRFTVFEKAAALSVHLLNMFRSLSSANTDSTFTGNVHQSSLQSIHRVYVSNRSVVSPIQYRLASCRTLSQCITLVQMKHRPQLHKQVRTNIAAPSLDQPYNCSGRVADMQVWSDNTNLVSGQQQHGAVKLFAMQADAQTWSSCFAQTYIKQKT